MAMNTATLLHRQLETTLQLIISLSPTMADDDILMFRIRLTEARLIMGGILAERDASGATVYDDGDPTAHVLSTATPHGPASANANHGEPGNEGHATNSPAISRPTPFSNPTLRRTVRRPVARGGIRHPPAIRASTSQLAQFPSNGLAEAVSAESSDDN